MPADQNKLDQGDEQLLTLVTPLVRWEAEVPPTVVEAAKALFDWARIDSVLAEVTADRLPVTRADGDDLAPTLMVWSGDDVEIRVEVEPAGYRRRRVVVVVQPLADGETVAVSLQRGDGSSQQVEPDALGDYVAELAYGALRVVATVGERTLSTPWFTI